MATRFGKYLLGASIGGGTFGEVFEATCEDNDGPTGRLAVKRLHRAYKSSSGHRQLFLAECQVSLGIRHPNLVHAIEAGEADDLPYLAMARAPGRSLAESAPDLGSLGALARDLGEGLDYLHSMGLVHADVCPANVVWHADLGTVLLDLSAAGRLGERQEAVRGTYGYIAPEQVRREPLGQESDQFALAVVLWEALAGRRLFARSMPHLTMMAVVSDPVPPIDSSLADAEQVLQLALAKDREVRFASCAEFAQAFAAALASIRPETRDGA